MLPHSIPKLFVWLPSLRDVEELEPRQARDKGSDLAIAELRVSEPRFPHRNRQVRSHLEKELQVGRGKVRRREQVVAALVHHLKGADRFEPDNQRNRQNGAHIEAGLSGQVFAKVLILQGGVSDVRLPSLDDLSDHPLTLLHG